MMRRGRSGWFAARSQSVRPSGWMSGSAFSPRQLTGLVLWLDADDGGTLFQNSTRTVGVASSGDPVGGWTDKGSNTYHATQVTAAKRGTYRAGAANGRGAVELDGTDDFLTVARMTGRLGGGYTLLLALRVFEGNPPDFRRPFGSRVVSPRQAYFDLLLASTGSLSQMVWVDHVTYQQTIATLGAGDSGWLVASVVATPGSSVACYLNGVSMGSVSLAGSAWGNIAAAVPETPLIGAISNGGTDIGHCACQVAEVLIYNRPLGTTERQQVEEYAKGKLGLTT